MKVKSLERRYFESKDRGRMCLTIMREMVNDIETLSEKRHVKTLSGVINVIKEKDNQWRAFARRVFRVNPDGFYLTLKNHFITTGNEEDWKKIEPELKTPDGTWKPRKEGEE